MDDAASWLLAARAGQKWGRLPETLRPASEADAYAIQHRVMAALGPIGGWKVGAAGPDARPSCAPMPAAGLHADGAALPRAAFHTREVESEIAFRLAADLPPRAAPYSRADIIAAIGACHAGIEVLQSRYADPAACTPLENLADFIRHGAYVVGTAVDNWQAVDFPRLAVTQTVDGAALTRTGNPAGDMIRLIQFLADEGARWAGGLRAGQIVTCGSWTGATAAEAAAATRFGEVATAHVSFV